METPRRYRGSFDSVRKKKRKKTENIERRREIGERGEEIKKKERIVVFLSVLAVVVIQRLSADPKCMT